MPVIPAPSKTGQHSHTLAFQFFIQLCFARGTDVMLLAVNCDLRASLDRVAKIALVNLHTSSLEVED
jgi:hypothetical protein